MNSLCNLPEVLAIAGLETAFILRRWCNYWINVAYFYFFFVHFPKMRRSPCTLLRSKRLTHYRALMCTVMMLGALTSKPGAADDSIGSECAGGQAVSEFCALVSNHPWSGRAWQVRYTSFVCEYIEKVRVRFLPMESLQSNFHCTSSY
jgi:hypothetical protein